VGDALFNAIHAATKKITAIADFEHRKSRLNMAGEFAEFMTQAEKLDRLRGKPRPSGRGQDRQQVA